MRVPRALIAKPIAQGPGELVALITEQHVCPDADAEDPAEISPE